MSRPSVESVIEDVERKIHRERVLIQGAKAMRRSTMNQTVRQQCDTNIREAEKNIRYLEEKLRTLREPAGSRGVHAGQANGQTFTNPEAAEAGAPQSSSALANYTRMDLLRYDWPNMGPRIQMMLQQLEFKLSVEQQYKAGIQKLLLLYDENGDRKSHEEALENLAESNAKLAMLSRSLKRYSDLHLVIDDDMPQPDTLFTNSRRPQTGLLFLTVKQILDVDHTASSAWDSAAETYVVIKVENQIVGQKKINSDSALNEQMEIAVDKANEIELLIYDQSRESRTPIAVLYLRVTEIVEAIRRKRVEMTATSGWANAATVQRHQSMLPQDGQHPQQQQQQQQPLSEQQQALSTPARSSQTHLPDTSSHADPTIDDWFILEPAGRIHLQLGFQKTINGVKRSYGGNSNGLGRHNAVRKYEETQDVHGHKFAHPQIYNIMVCAICGEFMTSPYQCLECKFACHRKCVSKVVTKCVSGIDSDEQLNHRIPHRLEPASNMRANWCAHCGQILPLGKKNIRKCAECGVMCHAACVKFIPDFCGMSMEMAYLIVSEIKSTRIRQVTKAAAQAQQTQKQIGGNPAKTAPPRPPPPPPPPSQAAQNQKSRQQPYSPYGTAASAVQKPQEKRHSRQEPIKRKQVGSTPYGPSSSASSIITKAEAIDRARPGLISPVSAAHMQPVVEHQLPSVPPAQPAQPARAGIPAWWTPSEGARDKESKALPPAPVQSQLPSDQNRKDSDASTTPETPESVLRPQPPVATVSELSLSQDHAEKATVEDRDTQCDEEQDQESDMSDSAAPEAEGYVPMEDDDQVSSKGATLDISAAAAASALLSSVSIHQAEDDEPKITQPARAPVSSKDAVQLSSAAAAAASAAAAAAYTPSAPQQPTRQSIVSVAPTVPETPAPHGRRRKIGLDDFSFLAVLGKGNFGKVMLAESKATQRLYAVKVLKKNYILENRELESMRSEKRVFLIANREKHPFLVNLSACFQTEKRIYFVMDYVSGGDLMYHIQKQLFTPQQAQFYAAEVLLALRHFHENEVIYRDLKLDNILLTLDGHIKVADYGLCKEGIGYGKTTATFCGTPEFMAPEILLDQKYGREVDWWALGVLIYQMLLGKSPFHGKDDEEIYDSILSDEPLYPIHMPRDSVSILQQLLTRDPLRRLGSGPRDALDIMEHPYFANINFDDLLHLKVPTPYRPKLDSPTDVRFFDSEFTSEVPSLTPMNSVIDTAMQEHFRGFSCVESEI